jgi:hypothetical protein
LKLRAAWAMLRRMRALGERCLVAIATTALPGCSLLFTSAPPSGVEPGAEVRCTSSIAAPIADTALAGLQGVRTGLALASDESRYEGAVITRDTDIALGVSLTALHGVSAAYGYIVTGRCRQLRAGRRDPPAQVIQEPPPAQPQPEPAPAPAWRCVPAATQACVGPGACPGGQACLPDGLSWGACQCA